MDLSWKGIKTAAAFLGFKETTGMAAGSTVVGALDPTKNTAHEGMLSRVEAIATTSPLKVADGALQAARQIGENILQDVPKPTIQATSTDVPKLGFTHAATSLCAHVPATDARMLLYGAVSVGVSALAVKALHKANDMRKENKAEQAVQALQVADVARDEKPAPSHSPAAPSGMPALARS